MSDRFDTELEAFNSYKNKKKELAKQLAFMYKDVLDSRVFCILSNINIEIYLNK